MKLGNVFQPIRDWALDKRIIQDGNMVQQYVKFQEEAGELAKAILKNNTEVTELTTKLKQPPIIALL